MPEVFRNYVAGQWVECKSKKTFSNVNPANTQEIVGSFQASAAEDVQEACDVAAKAQPAWAALPAPRRGEYLFKAAEILEGRLAKLKDVVALPPQEVSGTSLSGVNRVVPFVTDPAL